MNPSLAFSLSISFSLLVIRLCTFPLTLNPAGSKSYRSRRAGERKRKSVRGCIVDSNLSVLNVAVVQKGEAEIPGLTGL